MKLDVIESDPTDNKYLECAVEGKADLIISGDHHLTDLKAYRGIEIVSPAEFLKAVKDLWNEKLQSLTWQINWKNWQT